VLHQGTGGGTHGVCSFLTNSQEAVICQSLRFCSREKSCGRGAAQVAVVAEEAEADLEMVGITAIEDKLQVGGSIWQMDRYS
jgi:hypothetical protein